MQRVYKPELIFPPNPTAPGISPPETFVPASLSLSGHYHQSGQAPPSSIKEVVSLPHTEALHSPPNTAS